MPGVTASLEEHPNGSYILQQIKVDGNYQQLQRDSQKPGLWRVGKGLSERPVFQTDGNILNKEYRPVVVTDMAEFDAPKIAGIIRKNMPKTEGAIKDIARIQGFGMHYTAGEGGIVGLKNAKKHWQRQKMQILFSRPPYSPVPCIKREI